MAHHATHAGERVIDEKVVPSIHELSNSFSNAEGIQPHSPRSSLGDVFSSTADIAVVALRIRSQRKGIEPPAWNSRRQQDAGKPELIANLTESKSFRLAGYYFSSEELGQAINHGALDAGAVIPYSYARDLQRGRTTSVQFILNAMNANTATIAQGYAQGVIQNYNRLLNRWRSQNSGGLVLLRPAFLYNPGLVDSWFIATGVFGLLLILNSSLVASGAMVKEREAGTIEQLLMSPASTSEISSPKSRHYSYCCV
jgi:hypothetical protein